MYEELLIGYLESLPLKAKCYILKNIDKLNYDTIGFMWDIVQDCKSPIEFILAIALFIRTNGELFFETQMEIAYKKKKYYGDIGIYGDKYINSFLKEDFVLIIECDGYEFHQKTKKQVENDNKREYDIKMLGYNILRFSGSEIYNNVDLCVDKILNYLSTIGRKNE